LGADKHGTTQYKPTLSPLPFFLNTYRAWLQSSTQLAGKLCWRLQLRHLLLLLLQQLLVLLRGCCPLFSSWLCSYPLQDTAVVCGSPF
jgi:hypothetical protein